MADKNDILLTIYKDARDTVRHFDVILSNFRKIAFTFNSTIVAGYIGAIISKSIATKTSLMQQAGVWVKENSLLIWLVAIVFNYLLWFLEKHYHKYLMFSAEVAKNIESSLASIIGGDKIPLYSLSERIYYASTMKGPYISRALSQIKRFFRVNYYDTIYLIPIVAMNITVYAYTSEIRWLLNFSMFFQAYLLLYLLAYDNEVKRKLSQKIKMWRIEKLCKMHTKKAAVFARRAFRLWCKKKIWNK